MRRVALLVSYDGTNYAGWQVQKSERTVQEVMERAVARVCKEELRITASGRTDSGVHALGQVCHFETGGKGPPGKKFSLALNKELPGDVRVLRSIEAEGDFHARYSARGREYRYFLVGGEMCTPFQRRYSYLRRKLPPIELLNRYASLFTGRRDFTSFAAEKDENESKIRTVYSCCFFYEGPYIVFRVVGDSFLWKMVRTMLGTILELAEKDITPKRITRILEDRDRKSAGATAPARGLFLYRVQYDGRLFT